MGYLGISGIEFLAPERLWAIPGVLLFFAAISILSFRRLAELKRTLFAREFIRKEDVLPFRMKVVAVFATALAAVCFALAWAMPVAIQEISTPRFGGIRLTYISDVSVSMDALDVKEGEEATSRIAAGKRFLFAFERALASDPEIRGSYPRTVIPFAGATTTYGGWTTSAVYIRELITALSTEGMIGKQGSDLALALETYRELMEEHPKESTMTDIGIIISDGGNDPGGFVIDVGALRATLALLHGNAEIVTVGLGDDAPSTIPNRRIGEVATIAGEFGETVMVPDPRLVERTQGVLKKPNGDPWLSAFDEEMMADLAGAPERCFRLAPGAASGSGAHRCGRVESVEGMVGEIKKLLLKKRTALPPSVSMRRTSIIHWFGAFGIIFLLTGLLCERTYGLWRRRMAEHPMREVLFRRVVD